VIEVWYFYQICLEDSHKSEILQYLQELSYENQFAWTIIDSEQFNEFKKWYKDWNFDVHKDKKVYNLLTNLIIYSILC